MKLLRKVFDETYSDLKNINKVVLVSAFSSPFLLLLSFSNSNIYFISIPACILLIIVIISIFNFFQNNYNRLKQKEEFLWDGRHVIKINSWRKKIVNLKNGIREGLFQEYYQGRLRHEVNYKAGKMDGLSKEWWHESDIIKTEINYKSKK